jgi:uncharacterized membrane protein YccC
MGEKVLFFSPSPKLFGAISLVCFFFFGGHSLVCYSYLAFASSVIHYFCFAGHTVWELPCCRLMIDNVAIFVVGNGITNL